MLHGQGGSGEKTYPCLNGGRKGGRAWSTGNPGAMDPGEGEWSSAQVPMEKHMEARLGRLALGGWARR